MWLLKPLVWTLNKVHIIIKRLTVYLDPISVKICTYSFMLVYQKSIVEVFDSIVLRLY